jgi:hypothetical protein
VAVRNPFEHLNMMISQKKIYIQHLIILISFLLNFSCEVDRSSIGVEEQPQYSYNYINDYDYDYSRYFFIDTYYFDRYEKGFSEDLQIWSYEEGTLIRELNVYRSSSFTNNRARFGVATIPSIMDEFNNMQNLEGVSSKSGEVELSLFVPLEEGKNYEYDYARGYIRLTYKIRDYDILAVAYRTDKDTVGTLQSMIIDGDTTQFYVLRLIKSPAMLESHKHVWPLMMRNVYFLGDTSFVREGFNISIRKRENYETKQNVEPKQSFLNLLGLDISKDYGELVEGGDTIIDFNFFLVDRYQGILMFPGLQPFDPLPESRFQLADTNRARIYSTSNRNELSSLSKFEIVVQYISK